MRHLGSMIFTDYEQHKRQEAKNLLEGKTCEYCVKQCRHNKEGSTCHEWNKDVSQHLIDFYKSVQLMKQAAKEWRERKNDEFAGSQN
jgi:hypothetical protein